ncbi:unnamed protein product [Adineta steineri]|uniref:THAP-type domain-containing protein n=1 Tax=Adineta steineri TaxID=433720 RepID=A0A814KVN7_9BILA|nr:unnamed protein product [Adineta steineri]CAF1057509.1 unnamed protein product [Adineta steineri]
MPATCIVVGCGKKYGDVGQGRRKVALFHLPTNLTILKKWCDILSINCNNLSVAKTERVCSQHFFKQDLTYSERRTILAKGAIPIHTSTPGESVRVSCLRSRDN